MVTSKECTIGKNKALHETRFAVTEEKQMKPSPTQWGWLGAWAVTGSARSVALGVESRRQNSHSEPGGEKAGPRRH